MLRDILKSKESFYRITYKPLSSSSEDVDPVCSECGSTAVGIYYAHDTLSGQEYHKRSFACYHHIWTVFHSFSLKVNPPKRQTGDISITRRQMNMLSRDDNMRVIVVHIGYQKDRERLQIGHTWSSPRSDRDSMFLRLYDIRHIYEFQSKKHLHDFLYQTVTHTYLQEHGYIT